MVFVLDFLDVTTNALVALYFACNSDKDKDGQVIVFSGRCLSKFDPYVSIIADTYNLTKGRSISVTEYKKLAFRQSYCLSMDVQEDDEFIRNIQEPIFVEPGYITARQYNQSGKFILFPNIIHGHTIVRGIAPINRGLDPSVIALINIPYEAKQPILDGLRILGITRGFLFPDDIDSYCKEMVNDIDKRFK